MFRRFERQIEVMETLLSLGALPSFAEAAFAQLSMPRWLRPVAFRHGDFPSPHDVLAISVSMAARPSAISARLQPLIIAPAGSQLRLCRTFGAASSRAVVISVVLVWAASFSR